MIRSISVSTEVFAAIWASRREGEESEDAILRRTFGCQSQPLRQAEPVAGRGVQDLRNGVNFPEGFEIFRTYKRRDYAAQARNGNWLRLDNGQTFPTLNQLNASIAAGSENVWNGNWKYRHSDGTLRSIAELRG